MQTPGTEGNPSLEIRGFALGQEVRVVSDQHWGKVVVVDAWRRQYADEALTGPFYTVRHHFGVEKSYDITELEAWPMSKRQ